MSASKLLNMRFAVGLAVLLCGAALAYGIAQETPVGSLEGTILAQESGAPLDTYLQLTPVQTGDHAQPIYRESKNGQFKFARLPAGQYTLEARTQFHFAPAIKVSIEEGKTSRIRIELAPGEPRFDMYVHQHIFTPDERAQVTCQGFVEADRIGVGIYKVDLDAFLAKSSGSLRKLLGLTSYYYPGSNGPSTDLPANSALKQVESFDRMINTFESEGNFTQRIDLPTLAPGMYVVATRAGGIQRLAWIAVTSLGLVTKTAGRQVLAYATDLKTGAPVASAEVTIYSASQAVASGKTGPDGRVNLTVPGGQEESDTTIAARSGESFAFVSASMSTMETGRSLIYAYTDRPVYRPGQRVYFKGIVRKPSGGGYKTPSQEKVTVEVRDSRDTLIYRAVKTTNRFGSYYGHFDLNPETTTGNYTLVSTPDEEGRGKSTHFQVAAYSKPEFSVGVKFGRKRYIRNDQVMATISAAYYFGAPVANATVIYTVRRSPYWLFEEDQEDTSDGSYYQDEEGDGGYQDYGGYGEQVVEGEARTDTNGEAVIEFPAAWETPGEQGWDSDQQYSVDVYVTDKSRRDANITESVVVTRGEFAISVRPDRSVVEPGQPVNVSIAAVDYDKRPVKSQDLTVVIGATKWSNDGESTFETLEERRLTTDRLGRASLDFRPRKSGDIEVIVRSTDARGNRITGQAYVWCYSDEFGEVEGARYPDLQIVTDKKIYSPGDTAKVLINTKKPGAAALVTVEGERVYASFTVPLKGKSTTVEIPVKAEYRPNFYIGVCFVRDKNFASQEARAKVSLASQNLQVSIKPDRTRYKPGDKATYRITAKDAKGRPAVAELSVGVVDEAIYAIAPDNTPAILGYFYARRPNRVGTNFSFPEIYLSDPDKAGMASMPKTGPEIRVRKRFLDTAFWEPSVVTDARGEATVSFQLPDNLTTWRTTVRGMTLDTSCGEARNTVLAQQDMLVRLETPRFLVQSDRTTISAVVHNYTGEGQHVKVEIRAHGLTVDGSMHSEVFVENGGSERVDWDVSAPKPGSFPITVYARATNAGDAMQLTLPVYPHGEQRQTTQTGAMQASTTKKLVINVRRDSIPEATRLKLRLAPSLAAVMLGSLDYLAQYPYGCTEQTTSSFLPDVILARSLKDLGIRNARLEAKLPDMVSKGLFRLYRFQLEDGGWSWCEYGKSDPWMTAYVCYALVVARNAGFPVNKSILDQGLNRLRESISKPKLDVDTRAYGYYVLALAKGGAEVGGQIAELDRMQHLDSRGLALVTLGLVETGQTERAKETLARLFARAVVEPPMIHWAGAGWDPTDVETTALVLQAALKVNQSDPRVYQIVTWLMKQRRDNCWYSTRDTAMTLYAMSSFLKVSQELAPDYDATILVNGKVARKVHFDKNSIFQPDVEVTLTDLHKGRNQIEIHKSGVGNLYYSANLTQYLAMENIPATVTGAGLSITREYFKPGSRYYEEMRESDIGSPVTGCDSGVIILVRLTVNASERLEHLLLEDNIPAGCEIIDKGHVDYWEWDYWYVGRDIRDDKISFYLNDLQPGKHVVTYQMRAGIPGDYHAMPAQVFGMYQPEVRAATEETGFEIR